MMSNPMKPATPEQRHHGVACVTARDFRWERGDIKSISLLGNVLARQISADHGAMETIMFRDGWLTEAAASNVWIVQRRRPAGPAQERARARGHPLRAAARALRGRGIAYNLRPISESRRAQRRRGDAQLGHEGGAARHQHRRRGRGPRRLRGKPGPVYARLYEAYQRAKPLMSI
jgi:D-alanine transaminase